MSERAAPKAVEIRVEVLVVGKPGGWFHTMGEPSEAFRVAQDALATLAKRNGGGER